MLFKQLEYESHILNYEKLFLFHPGLQLQQKVYPTDTWHITWGKTKVMKFFLTRTQSTKWGKRDKNKAETNSTEYGMKSNTTAARQLNHATKCSTDTSEKRCLRVTVGVGHLHQHLGLHLIYSIFLIITSVIVSVSVLCLGCPGVLHTPKLPRTYFP